MDLDQLRVFLAVLEHESFSHAAEALRVSQSTVSFHIKALEASIGTQLVHRGGGAAKATAAGLTLRRYARRLIALRGEALAQLRAEEEGERGHLSIAASTVPAEYLVPRMLSAFRRTHPGISFTISVSDSRGCLARLSAQDCDLALVGARLADDRIVYSAVADDEVVLVGPAPDPFDLPDRLSPEELRRVPLVLREEGSGTRRAVAALLRRSARGDAVATIEVGSNQAAKRCVLAGVGCTFISRRAVAEELAADRLRVIALAGTPVRRRFYAARLRSRPPSPATRVLLSLLKKIEF